MKTINKYITLAIVLSMTWMAQTQTQVSANVVDCTQQESIYTDDTNHALFYLDAPASGNYHIRFWLNPASSDNISFQNHKVIINGEEVGDLMPTSPDWQSIAINDTESVMLYQGENEIIITGDAISAPMVDMVRIAENGDDAEIYPCDPINQSGISLLADDSILVATTEATASQSYELTAYYSFSKQLRLYPGQLISITTTGELPHGVDFFLYRNNDSTNQNVGTNDLNWYGGSAAYSSTSTNHRATIETKIPVQGVYKIMLRSGMSGIQQTISNLKICVKDSINDTDSTIYTYNDCAASFTRLDTFIPADGTEYRVQAKNFMGQLNRLAAIDVCVEGDASQPGRVVRHFTTGANGTTATYNIGHVDAQYQIPATGVHVSINNSLSAHHTCQITIGATPEGTGGLVVAQAKKSTSVETISINDNTPTVEARDNQLIINHIDSKTLVEVYSLSGAVVYRGADSVIRLAEPGIYIVRVGAETYKVAI